MVSSTCFLCSPDEKLRVTEAPGTYVMAGLGPLTHTYALIAGRAHSPSLADLALTDSTVCSEIEAHRVKLEERIGPLLMTEHGRVPVCRDDSDQHEPHCFHGHALLFGSTPILQQAKTYYGRHETFSCLAKALAHAATVDSYLLVSETRHRFSVLAGPLNAPRQLARTLVAITSGETHLSDWRTSPRLNAALRMAANLRTCYGVDT